jgi:hypothetical protein
MKKTSNSQSLTDEKINDNTTDFEQLKQMFLAQQNTITDLKNQVEVLSKPKAGRPSKSPTEYRDIRPDDYVKIMSLNNKPMNISSEPRFQGKALSFTYFGETKKVLYSEFLDIKENHKNFFEQGLFYLLDEGRGIIKELGYEELYEHILTKEKIEDILNSNPNAFNFFQSANKKQQELIINMLIIKLRDGQSVDRNLIADISRYSGIDIEAKVKKALDDIAYEEGLKNLKK